MATENSQPSQQSFDEAETTLEALRRQEVDAVVGNSQVLVLRLQEAEQALRRQAQIIEQVHNALITTDLEAYITQWNAGATRLYGYTAEEALGEHLSLLYFEEDLPVLHDQVLASLRAKGAHQVEVRCRHKTGEARHVHLSLSLLRNKEGTESGIITSAVDITERKEAEAERERLLAVLAEERAQLSELTGSLEQRVQKQTQQVRDLAADLSLAEYRERKRISQLLHDNVQQLIYSVQFFTQSLRKDSEEEQAARLDQVDTLLKQAAQTTRTLSVELSPPVLKSKGLREGVAWLADQMKEMHGLVVKLDIREQGAIVDKHLQILVFQIVRELLFNVVKHGQVDEAEVILRQEDDRLLVTVKDEGQGFDTSAVPERTDTQTGLGLHSIRDRVDLFGGRMELHSEPGTGTQVDLSFPLDKSTQ